VYGTVDNDIEAEGGWNWLRIVSSYWLLY